MRSQLAGTRIDESTLMAGNRFGVLELTLAATFDVPSGSPQVLVLDPGGAARTVRMPASPQKGDWFLLINTADAAEVITVQDSAGVGLTPACTPAQSESALLVYINATLGWRQFVAIGA